MCVNTHVGVYVLVLMYVYTYIVFMYIGVCMYVCHVCTQVRWAGLVRASLASPYTFHTSLSGEKANHERVKLWIDGQAQIFKKSNSNIEDMLRH